MSFNFKTQLKAGKLGEMLFLQANAGHITVSDKFDYDFVTVNGTGLELKTDFYSMDSTPNFFFERWSSLDDKKPGGPWQSLGKGAVTFVYFYIPSLTYFTFNTDELVGRLEELTPKMTPYDVKNTSHITRGYRVPRDAVADIALVTNLKVVKTDYNPYAPTCVGAADHPYACGCKDVD